MDPYVRLYKELGKTPLETIESYKEAHPHLASVPMAYAGRLDPMAEGALLVLQGNECKKQESYHALDKEYIFEILFGISSDTADVLGLTTACEAPLIDAALLKGALRDLVGDIALPYPHFSSKTVHGKPLHTWKLEGKIHEIEIPTKESTLYSLSLLDVRQADIQTIKEEVADKIAKVTPVTDPRKALGNDFRRVDVLASWEALCQQSDPHTMYTIAKIRCVASSGTYMRTLAEVIASKLGTCGLAYSITRTKIGMYMTLPFNTGLWKKRY